MTIETPSGEGGETRPLISEATLLYTAAAEVFAQMIRGLRDGTQDDARKAPGQARELRQALQAVLTERAIIERLRDEEAGGSGGGGLDLDAARAEIGRRLACLRAAAGD